MYTFNKLAQSSKGLLLVLELCGHVINNGAGCAAFDEHAGAALRAHLLPALSLPVLEAL